MEKLNLMAGFLFKYWKSILRATFWAKHLMLGAKCFFSAKNAKFQFLELSYEENYLISIFFLFSSWCLRKTPEKNLVPLDFQTIFQNLVRFMDFYLISLKKKVGFSQLCNHGQLLRWAHKNLFLTSPLTIYDLYASRQWAAVWLWCGMAGIGAMN